MGSRSIDRDALETSQVNPLELTCSRRVAHQLLWDLGFFRLRGTVKMDPPMEWKLHPPYSATNPGFRPLYTAACFCGAIRFEVDADPVDSKICHCSTCQRLHGAPFQWAVIFHKHNVRFVRGVDDLDSYAAGTMQAAHVLPCKLSCKHCRTPIADEGRNMFLAFGPLFDFGSPPRIPPAFEPSCHIFYGSRLIDVDDGRPKYPGHKPARPARD